MHVLTTPRPTVLVHNTSKAAANQIAFGSNELLPSKCKIFNENLLYFFLMRLAYRVPVEDDFPHVFVVLTDAVEQFNIARTFPFDSGGFHGHFFDLKPPGQWNLNNTQIPNGTEFMIRLWQRGDYYFDFDVKGLRALPDFTSLENACVELIKNPPPGADDRCGSVEVSVRSAVEKKDWNVVIVPLDVMGLWAENGNFDSLQEVRWYANTGSPIDNHAKAVLELREYLNENNLL